MGKKIQVMVTDRFGKEAKMQDFAIVCMSKMIIKMRIKKRVKNFEESHLFHSRMSWMSVQKFASGTTGQCH